MYVFFISPHPCIFWFTQRRLDGSVNFTQPWQDYRDGFGQHGAATELWHGNENVRRMCSQRPQRMLIEMVSFDDESAFVMYDNFSLADEEHKFKLTVCFLSGCFTRFVCMNT